MESFREEEREEPRLADTDEVLVVESLELVQTASPPAKQPTARAGQTNPTADVGSARAAIRSVPPRARSARDLHLHLTRAASMTSRLLPTLFHSPSQ